MSNDAVRLRTGLYDAVTLLPRQQRATCTMPTAQPVTPVCISKVTEYKRTLVRHVLTPEITCVGSRLLILIPVLLCFPIKTKKRAIAKALQLEGHPDFVPVDLGILSAFSVFLFENIAFWEVPSGNHPYRARGVTRTCQR